MNTKKPSILSQMKTGMKNPKILDIVLLLLVAIGVYSFFLSVKTVRLNMEESRINMEESRINMEAVKINMESSKINMEGVITGSRLQNLRRLGLILVRYEIIDDYAYAVYRSARESQECYIDEYGQVEFCIPVWDLNLRMVQPLQE